MEEKELVKVATKKIIELFGRKYLQDTYDGSCTAYGMVDDDTFLFFLGIKGDYELPDREANDHGWVVYAKVLIDKATGMIKDVDYVLE